VVPDELRQIPEFRKGIDAAFDTARAALSNYWKSKDQDAQEAASWSGRTFDAARIGPQPAGAGGGYVTHWVAAFG
jgi:hypothetical protein